MLPATSRAMVQTAPRRLEMQELALPDLADDTAILQVEACGICGSDYEQYEDRIRAPIPAIPGHEPLGRIAAIGDAAAKRWGVDVGDRVAVEPLLPCHRCDVCRSGQYQRCMQLTLYSFVPTTVAPALWGGYAEYLHLDPRSIVHKVDPALPPELAVMFNPLGAGFRWAVEVAGTMVGDSVLVMGPGQRGLACVIAAKMAGAGPIIVTGLSGDADKLALALRFGADHVIDVEQEDIKQVWSLTGDRGADRIVDTTPYAIEPVRDAIRVARRGATLVLAGMKGHRPYDGFAGDSVIGKELTVKGASGVTSSGYRKAIQAIESGRFPLQEMHTHGFRLEDSEVAIRTLANEVPGERSIHSCIFPST